SRDGEPEERRRMLLAVRQVVEKSLVPVAAEHDREGRVPDEIVAELADLGVFAALVPPAHGGLGLDPATWTMVIEEVARVWAPPAVVSLRGVRLPVLRPSSSAPRLLAVVDLGLGAVAVGLGQAAFEAALRYSQQRSTFGKAICQHQAVQLKLADMATRLTAARLLVGDAAARVAAADDGGAARRARRFAVDAAVAVTLESMRIHGGYGYTTE